MVVYEAKLHHKIALSLRSYEKETEHLTREVSRSLTGHPV